MELSLDDKQIFSIDAKPEGTVTATAATNLLTLNSHGFSNGDIVRFTTTTTLPAGLSASTDYYVIEASTNTFKVATAIDGSEVDITDAGTGTHTVKVYAKTLYVKGYDDLVVDLSTANNAEFVVKIIGSMQEDVNLRDAASASNRWAYLESKKGDDGGDTNGSVGVTYSGTDGVTRLALNTERVTYLTIEISSYTAGNLEARVSGGNK